LQRWAVPFVTSILLLVSASQELRAQTWTADNGNGTYSNPLFYDEFADPDIVRVGADYYLLGSSMHVNPGWPCFTRATW